MSDTGKINCAGRSPEGSVGQGDGEKWTRFGQKSIVDRIVCHSCKKEYSFHLA